jgi:glycosyltransferase involved in cell wall biosynthesis
MKITIIASSPDSLLNFRRDFLVLLVNNGHEVTALAGEASETILNSLADINVLFKKTFIQNTGLNPWKDLKTLFFLYKVLRKSKPDIVIAYTIKPVIYGTLASWMAGITRRFILITGLGYAFQGQNTRKLIKFLVCLLYKLVLKKTHGIFFQNPDDKNLLQKLKILPKKIPSYVVHGSGVNLKTYPSAPLSVEPRFLLIARLLGDKGIREYIEAARQILLRVPHASFHLAGWIDENPNSISQHELNDWVKEGVVQFHGYLDDVRPTIANTNIFVLPSYREGTPRSVLEAMAMGRPIITTDTPGCRETVVDGDNGFLVPIRSVDALVAAMQHFIAKPNLISSMGKRSRQIAEQKYDVHKVNAVMAREMGIF